MTRGPGRSTGGTRRRVLPAWLVCALLLISQPGLAQKAPTQYDVEAAYLFRFSKFLRQPARGSTFDICTLGDNPFGHTLQQITANEQVDSLRVRVLHLNRGAEARTCSILFLSASESPRLNEDLLAIRGADVLTVSDMPGFLGHGGMIQFVVEQERVRFSISLDAVAQTRLTLGSELLRVASSVIGKPRGEVTP